MERKKGFRGDLTGRKALEGFEREKRLWSGLEKKKGFGKDGRRKRFWRGLEGEKLRRGFERGESLWGGLEVGRKALERIGRRKKLW